MIYFAQALCGGPVKIGFSDNVPARIRQLEVSYRRPLAVLGTLPGDRDEERAIHGRFSHLRFGRTEQFRPAPELMEFIGRPLLVGANPEAVELMLTPTAPTPIRLTDSDRAKIELIRVRYGLPSAAAAVRYAVEAAHRALAAEPPRAARKRR